MSLCLCLWLWFLKGKNENHRSEICVWFVILKGKMVDLKFVLVIFVFMFVIVFGFGFVFVFVILGQKIINQNFCFWFWSGLVMRDGARGGRSESRKKNPFSKWAGSGLWVLAHRSGPGMKKPGPNSTRCHSYSNLPFKFCSTTMPIKIVKIGILHRIVEGRWDRRS